MNAYTSQPDPDDERMTFDLAGVLIGVRRALPIALGVLAYGLVFGVLARQARLSLAEALLMSGLVFAGASQFVALGLWATPLPTGTIVLTTLIVNLRHVLMGAALRPWFERLSPPAAYGSIFFLSDESWALTMAEFARGRRNGAFLLGSGLTIFAAWLSATVLGRLLGGAVSDPSRWGLDFAFTAAFIALLVGLWRGRSDLLPWTIAALVALLAEHLLPGKWYILAGGVAGSLAGALRHEP